MLDVAERQHIVEALIVSNQASRYGMLRERSITGVHQAFRGLVDRLVEVWVTAMVGTRLLRTANQKPGRPK